MMLLYGSVTALDNGGRDVRAVLYALLDDSAQVWLDTVPETTCWTEMKQLFLAKFGVSVFQAKALLEKCRHEQNERVALYFARIDAIAA